MSFALLRVHSLVYGKSCNARTSAVLSLVPCSLRSVRCSSSDSVSDGSSGVKSGVSGGEGGRGVHNSRLSFDDPKQAYRSKTTSEIFRGWFVFKLFSFNRLVDRNQKLMKWGRKILGDRGFKWLMKKTVYGQFIAGESRAAIQPVLDLYRKHGVRSILDYAVEEDLTEEVVIKAMGDDNELKVDSSNKMNELTAQFRAYQRFADRRYPQSSALTFFYQGEEKCNERVGIFAEAINASESMEKDGFIAIKLTALGQTSFLMHLSYILQQVRWVFSVLTDTDLPILQRQLTLPMFCDGLKQLGVRTSDSDLAAVFNQMTLRKGKTETVDLIDFVYFFRPTETDYTELFVTRDEDGREWPLVDNLTRAEVAQMGNVMDRLEVLAEKARSANVTMMIDAEQTYFQPAINRLGTKLIKKYNRGRPVIYNTYQCYLKDTEDLLAVDIELFRRLGVHIGAKVVRGAYMEQERERATQVRYSDPVHADRSATTHSYNRCIHRMMQAVCDHGAGLMVATHNEDSVHHATQLMAQLGIPPESNRVSFGQLLGMSDHITFALGQKGYRAYKYMPYGPVEEVLQYLSRRANENRGLFQGAVRERNLLRRELQRRMTFGLL